MALFFYPCVMKKSAYFEEGYLSFFRELAANNHKDWFDANRKIYLSEVKQPFENFVDALLEALRKKYKLGDLKASDCVFRINRDIRFSKDKTPYKIQMSALIAKGGRKNMDAPGLYIEFGPEFMNIYTGVYMPEKPTLQAIRERLAAEPDKFSKIINAKAFKENFGEVRGEKSKILPAALKEAAKAQSLIYNKQFYLIHTQDAEKILEPDLLAYVIKVYAAADPYNEFIY